MKKVLSIAGSDCSGGAGVQADLKTFSALGAYGMSVITSVVAENTCRVLAVSDVPPDMVARQIDAVFEDIEVDAVKIGMLPTPGCMREVAAKLNHYRPTNIVIDPVMYAKNGCPLMERDAVLALTKWVIPLADVLTPNIPETEQITGKKSIPSAIWKKAQKRFIKWDVKPWSSRADIPPKAPLTSCLTGKESGILTLPGSIPKTPTEPAVLFPQPSRRCSRRVCVWMPRCNRQRPM